MHVGTGSPSLLIYASIMLSKHGDYLMAGDFFIWKSSTGLYKYIVTQAQKMVKDADENIGHRVCYNYCVSTHEKLAQCHVELTVDLLGSEFHNNESERLF